MPFIYLSRSTMRYALIAISLAAMSFGVAAAPNASPLPPLDAQAGSPKLAEQWWQWAMAFPPETNPVSDQTGANCAVGQTGTTWFLAGNFGGGKVRRTCTVPAGRTLFFPLVNVVFYGSRAADASTCDEVKSTATLHNDAMIDLFAEVDGRPLTNLKQHRVASERCFAVFSRASPQRGGYKGFPAATDGYWVKMAPLAPGRHVLKFGGRYNRMSPEYGGMVQDIEYELIVQ